VLPADQAPTSSSARSPAALFGAASGRGSPSTAAQDRRYHGRLGEGVKTPHKRLEERSVAHPVKTAGHSTRWDRARHYGKAKRKPPARHCGGYGPELLGGGDVTGAVMDGPLTTLTGLGGFRDAQIAPLPRRQ
jgi:hypothetical protein